jgi:hypothetical protein
MDAWPLAGRDGRLQVGSMDAALSANNFVADSLVPSVGSVGKRIGNVLD